MRPPCETVQREYLPFLRTHLAKSLKKKGFSQLDIAAKLDVTQAAVSKYLNQSVEKNEMSPEILLLVDRLSDMMQNPQTRADIIIREICSTCMYSRLGSSLCRIHQNNTRSLQQLNCQICSELLGGGDESLSDRANVIKDIQQGLRNIESSASFERIVPQVRANLVACASDASKIEDVMGIPGRITIVGGRAIAPIAPQFGASHHTAEILLNARAIWKSIRACLCISGRKEVVEATAKHGFKIIVLQTSEIDAKRIFKDLALANEKQHKTRKLPAIHVPGGYGIEPILYLFDTSAKLLTEKCMKISDSISS